MQQGDRFIPADRHAAGQNVADADATAANATRLGREIIEHVAVHRQLQTTVCVGPDIVFPSFVTVTDPIGFIAYAV